MIQKLTIGLLPNKSFCIVTCDDGTEYQRDGDTFANIHLAYQYYINDWHDESSLTTWREIHPLLTR